MSNVSPYGSWQSPITSASIVSKSVRLGAIRHDETHLYWSELRPTEGGRQILVKYPLELARSADRDKQNASSSQLDDLQVLTAAPLNVRTRVHEYGGGAYTVHKGAVYFSNFADQRLYHQTADSDPVPLTPEVQPIAGLRFADAIVDEAHQQLICVMEDHRQGKEAINSIVTIPLSGGTPKTLVSGHDFYSSPQLSPDGLTLCWIAWNHPQMPWDGTELWQATLTTSGELSRPRQLAGGKTESIGQPRWSPDGQLYFISDATDWWNLYRWENGQAVAVFPLDAEFAGPQWNFGQRSYGFASADTLICTYSQTGQTYLTQIDLRSGEMDILLSEYSGISSLNVSNNAVVFIASSQDNPSAIIHLDLSTLERMTLRTSTDLTIDPAYISRPEFIAFPTAEGQTAYGIYYSPKNPDFTAPEGERPPLLVKTHGGPTASASSALNLGIQYWTSRGVAVLDVNYGGSTGYGRAYRNRLRENWGLVDVDDVVNGARYLVSQGKVDENRLTIDGGSAGGYTTLAALTFRDVFKAGASYYGVSDMSSLAAETHKFESRYLDSLVGPFPQMKSRYEERSPINAIDQLSCPIIFLQIIGNLASDSSHRGKPKRMTCLSCQSARPFSDMFKVAASRPAKSPRTTMPIKDRQFLVNRTALWIGRPRPRPSR